MLVKELEARAGAGREARIGLNAALELGLESWIFLEVFAGELLQNVSFPILALLKN